MLGNKQNLLCLFYYWFYYHDEAVSSGLMDVYLMDRCILLLWRCSVKSKPAAPAAVSVFSLLRLSLLPLVWFSGKSRAANARLLYQFKG